MNTAANAGLLELRGVGQSYAATERGAQVKVLEGIDLVVREGEIVAVLGRSGCGKSTLLRILCGLVVPSTGAVLYRSGPVRGPVPGVSMVFQNFALFPWLTVLQNVTLGLEAQGVDRAARLTRAEGVIEMIGLSGYESAYPKELSGGMRQRVGFARALVVNPDVLLMDEAFSALDVPTSESLRSDLLDLWIERLIPTQAIVMVSHNIEESLLLADRILVFDSNPGRIKDEVRITMKHPRDRESVSFRQLVEKIYAIMTTSAVEGAAGAGHPGRVGFAYRLPDVSVAQMCGVLEQIEQSGDQGRTELSELADEMHLELDVLFSIVDALEVLELAQVADRRIRLTRHGRAFVDGDLQRRKAIFADHLVRRVPLVAHILRVLEDRPMRRAPEERFLRELEDKLSEQESERVLSVAIQWGRYSELFGYDYDAGVLTMEAPEGEAEG
ncbi:MAG: nitrate ABC transporter ATP-binding protein [Chromatiales bacterium 21-64-14]|nr:MAG: nitrate ABC transporter ATP-binding protein [Chromatiales bacterium 21-64-14]HQU17286.1 nitrate/sulfonate/bicarbonate ABC transporter ATP-binding protein [Gammaproteobacteria bacterium]